MNIDENTVVTGVELADILGITDRRIRQLTADGILQRTKKGYNLANSAMAYIDYLRKPKRPVDEYSMQIRKAEVEIKMAKAEKAKREAEQLEAKMHKKEDVLILTNDLVYTIAEEIEAFANNEAMMNELIETSKPTESEAVLRKYVYALLRRLSEYDFDDGDFERKRDKWEPKFKRLKEEKEERSK